MKGFRRQGDYVLAEFEEFEVALVTSLTEQLVEVLGGEDTQDADCDAFTWLMQTSEQSVDLDRSDPLIERLFPDAYADDPKAADDFRRFTQDEARRKRVDECRLVLDGLEATLEGSRPLRVASGRVDAWLRTLNALRLSLSVRLGIVDEDSVEEIQHLSPRDPRSQLADIFAWLGVVLDSLVEVL